MGFDAEHLKKKSTGHLMFCEEYEYYQFNDTVYCAPLHNAFMITPNVRHGRFVCPMRMWDRIKKNLIKTGNK